MKFEVLYKQNQVKFKNKKIKGNLWVSRQHVKKKYHNGEKNQMRVLVLLENYK